MAERDVVIRVTVRGSSEGVPAVTEDLRKLAAAHKDVSIAAETTTKSQLSAEKVFERRQRQFDMAARQAKELAALERDIERFRQQGIGTGEDYNRMLAGMAERHTAASRSQKSLADTTKLSRYEMINLSRQFQDVAVGLQAGQSPFTVLVQQGSQIADVFASSQATVRSFFSNALGWAGRFAMSTAGVVTGVTAIGGAALYAAASWSAGQREIDKALAGIGRASGVTRDQINSIATASAGTTAASANEAREAATVFAGTGKIYAESIQAATDLTKDFARATGTDMAAAAKKLAEFFVDPVKGADELAKTFGGLDGRTREYIKTLDTQGKTQEAGRALMDAFRSSIQQQAQNIGLLERAWDAATKALSEYWDEAARKPAARTIERVTGADMGGFSQQERLDRARAELAGQERAVTAERAIPAGAVPSMGLGEMGAAEKAAASARAEVQKLEAAFAAAAKAAADERFAQFSRESDAAVKSLQPQIGQLDALEKKLTALRRAREGVPAITGIEAGYGGEAAAPARSAQEVRGRMGVSDQDLKRAEDAAKVLQQTIIETANQTARANAHAVTLGETYKGISLDVAKQLELQNAQLGVAQAVTGAEQLIAQEKARVVQLTQEGRSAEEAALLAAGERLAAQAQINAEAERTLQALQAQEAIAGAVTERQRQAAQEAATYEAEIRKGVSAWKAMEIAAQQTANAQAQIDAQAAGMLQKLQDRRAIIEAEVGSVKAAAEAQATYNDLIRQGVSERDASAIAAEQEAQSLLRIEEQITRERDAKFEAERASRAIAAADAARINYLQQSADLAEKEAYSRDKAARAARGESEFGGSLNPPGAAVDIARTKSRALTFGYAFNEKTGELRPIRSQPPDYSKIAEFFLMTGGSYQGLIDKLLSLQPGPGGGLDQGFYGVLTDAIRRRGAEVGPAGEVDLLRAQISRLEQTPLSFARDDLIQQLNDRIRELTESTDSLNGSMRSILSELYTTDPRQSHLGFRTRAMGGVVTPYGELPLQKYQVGGIAYKPQVSIIAEGSMPEAYVPLPDGRSIPVDMRVQGMPWNATPANDDDEPTVIYNITNQYITIQGDVSQRALQEMKISAFQMNERQRA